MLSVDVISDHQGKMKFIKTLDRNIDLQDAALIFKNNKACADEIDAAGIKFLVVIYSDSRNHTSLDDIRYDIFAKVV